MIFRMIFVMIFSPIALGSSSVGLHSCLQSCLLERRPGTKLSQYIFKDHQKLINYEGC